MATKPVKTGIIGCGNISGIYFQNGKAFDILDIGGAPDTFLGAGCRAAHAFTGNLEIRKTGKRP